jgi:hypothetical protein
MMDIHGMANQNSLPQAMLFNELCNIICNMGIRVLWGMACVPVISKVLITRYPQALRFTSAPRK